MKVLSICILMLLLSQSILAQPPCAPARHAKLPKVSGFTYHKARPLLLKAGWQPFQTIHHNDASRDVNVQSGNGPIYWKRGYFELASCSGTGMGHCTFLFQDAYGNKLQVTTQGEEGRGSDKRYYYARISSYRFVCE